MKSPPRQFRDSVAHDACNAFIDGEPFDLPEASDEVACVPVFIRSRSGSRCFASFAAAGA